jgi:YcaO-like protein with predicted kinase domain
MPGSGAFLASTNGLASGNTLAEAVLHGLCEIMERDALALWEHAGEDAQHDSRLDLSTAEDPLVRQLLESYANAGIAVMAWNVTSDLGLPVVRCIIFDDSSHPELRPIPAAFGAGSHPNGSVALLRALTEAAQSRLTVIAGSRDDFGRARYRSSQNISTLEYYRRLSKDQSRSLSVDSLAIWNGRTVDEDIEYVLRLLETAGIPHIYFVNLSRDDLPISVVRVIVPMLEGPTESTAYTPGVRVRDLMQRLASI